MLEKSNKIVVVLKFKIERAISLPGDPECPDLHGACRMALDFLRPPLYQDNPIPTEEEVVEKLRGVLGEND